MKGLFLLAREAAADPGGRGIGGRRLPDRGDGHGRTVRLRATRPGAPFFPGHGGVAGLVKTLAREWPGVRCRVVDLDPDDAADVLAGRLVDEVFAVDGRAEVGYDRGRRIRLCTIPKPSARHRRRSRWPPASR